MRQTVAVVYYTLLETLRVRSLGWAAAALLALFAASFFLREIAIIDGQRLQTTFLAATSRLTCVLLTAVVIIGAVVREFNEQGHLLLLSLPLARGRYVVGKFLGFALLAVLVAAAAALPLALLAGVARALEWSTALGLELLLLSAMAVFAAFGLRQLLPALLATLGFYVLARGITGIQLLAHASGQTEGLAWVVDGLALLLPALDDFAASARLVGDAAGLGKAAVQTVIYCALLLAAAVADALRRDL